MASRRTTKGNEVSDLRKLVEAKRLPPLEICRMLRLEAGLTMEDMAGLVGVTRQTVFLWETGRADPRGSNRLAYVRVLKELDELLDEVGLR